MGISSNGLALDSSIQRPSNAQREGIASARYVVSGGNSLSGSNAPPRMTKGIMTRGKTAAAASAVGTSAEIFKPITTPTLAATKRTAKIKPQFPSSSHPKAVNTSRMPHCIKQSNPNTHNFEHTYAYRLSPTIRSRL